MTPQQMAAALNKNLTLRTENLNWVAYRGNVGYVVAPIVGSMGSYGEEQTLNQAVAHMDFIARRDNTDWYISG